MGPEPSTILGARRLRLSRRRAGLLAIVVLGVALALPIQAVGWNQTSHYALVRALAHGTPRIDHWRHTTGDRARYHGHWYSARAPGLAIWEQPDYALVHAAHADRFKHIGPHHNDLPIWLLGLWGTVLPTCVLLLLVRAVAERLEPGFGTAAAITVGIGSLLLPFTTMLFSHVGAALLGFAAFAILFQERYSERRRPLLLGAAGLCIGLGVTTEYPTLLLGVVLGVYALSGHDTLRRPRKLLDRAGPYALGAVLGVVPLVLYNRWAFGSFTHLAYADIRAQQKGFFGIDAPRPGVIVQLLLDSRGLLTLTPVLGMAAVGGVLLYRTGRRAESLTIGAVTLVMLVYNSGYYLPFGGNVPGPRFLIPVIPFLAVALASAWRRFPGVTLALAAASAVGMLIPTMTEPMVRNESYAGVWTHWLRLPHLTATLATAAGVTSAWVSWLPVFLLLALSVALAVRATAAVELPVRQLLAGLAIACGWALYAAFGPHGLGIDQAAAHVLREAHQKHLGIHPYGPNPISGLALYCLGGAFAAVALAGLAQGIRTRKPPREMPLPVAPREPDVVSGLR